MKYRRYTLFLFLFAVSGFSGLIYESIWTHYLKLFLGHAAYAQTLVLAIFMGGMAIGSFISSRYSVKWRNLFRGYAIAEGLIGLSAILFHGIFDNVIRLSFDVVIPALGSSSVITAYKWGVSGLLILPQTVLLGMTFPLMSGAILRRYEENRGRSVSLLYFNNSIGAAAGVLISGFFLIDLVGLPWTIRFAGLLNIGLAAVVWLLSNKEAEDSIDQLRTVREGQGPSSLNYWAFLFISLVTGAASFIYEVGWIRMLSLVLGSSTHAFELMLSAFIIGLAFGGLWIQRRIDGITNTGLYLGKVQIIMGLLALMTLPVYGMTFGVMEWLLKNIAKSDGGYALFNAASHGIASAIMLPAAFCAGMTLPLITFTLLGRGYGERSIGAVYAANTVGAIAGVIFAIHVGMPVMGLKGLLTFGSAMDISLGLGLVWLSEGRTARSAFNLKVTAVSAAAVILVLFFVELDTYKMASGVYREVGIMSRDNSRLIYHKDGKTATVSIVMQNNGVMHIRTNGKTDAGIYMKDGPVGHLDESTMTIAAVLPLMMKQDAKTVANIGFGSGLTTHTLLSSPNLEQVDTIEIESRMIEAARNFGPFVERGFTDPRSKLHIEDAKTFFSANRKKYDIIISEPSNPWVSGVSGLFSMEFYRLVSRHLADNGLFVQWMHLYEIDLPLVVSVLKAISSEFADYVVYTPNSEDILIVASNTVVPAPSPWLFGVPEMKRLFERVKVRNIQDVYVRKIGDKRFFGPYADSSTVPANSDYYPILDQRSAKSRFMKSMALDLVSPVNEPLPALDILTGTGTPAAETDVTDMPVLQRAISASRAMLVRDLLYGKSEKNVPDDLRGEVADLKRMFFECRTSSVNERVRILFNAAIDIVPYLSAEELENIWGILGKGSCSASFTASEKDWISLFRALGRRDAASTAETADRMLDGGQYRTGQELKYLLASQMVGRLATGEKQKAFSAWVKYKDTVFGSSEPYMLFRILAAKSMQ